MHARYYKPYWGRFLSVDPVLNIKGSLRKPQAWNRYSYVMNNPVRYTDPDGRECGGCLAFERDNQDLLHGRISVDEFNARNNARGGGALIGAAPYALWMAGGALNKLALNLMVRYEMATAMAAAGTAEGLRRAASSGGPTVQLTTNLTQAPQEGRALSAATGAGAEALANASRSGEGVKTFVAQIPQALLKGLEAAKLVTISTTQMNGVQATEYRFAPGAAQYIVKFFKEVVDKKQ
jgi:hypothetical protein